MDGGQLGTAPPLAAEEERDLDGLSDGASPPPGQKVVPEGVRG